MPKKEILFIINPNSGNKKGALVADVVDAYLDTNKFNYKVVLTEYAGHAIEITANAVNEKIDCVVAVGGDGMINEVFQSLVNTSTALGIIPFGSGNGVARSLGIPMNYKRAIKLLNRASIRIIDTGRFNEKPFLGVAGIGFDGLISAEFSRSASRGLKTYLKLILKNFFNYQSNDYSIEVKDQRIDAKAFIIAFANTNQYGNNAIIAPNARVDDGKLDIVVFKDMPKWKIPIVAMKIMNGTIHNSKDVIILQNAEVKVSTNASEAHIDGEPISTNKENTVHIIPNSLRVMVQ